MPIDWSQFAKQIAPYQKFILTSHIRPDADALGSELGMAGVLRALGKHVRIVNGQSTPPNLKFLDPAGEIKAIGVDVTAEQLADADALIVLDTSAWAQLGPMSDVIRTTKAKKFVVDHHLSEDDLGAESFKDTSSEATGRLITDAAAALGVKLTPEIATPLFAALATDTGWYRFLSTTGGTYRAAAALVEAGAVPGQIYKQLYEQDTLGRIHLIGRVLERAEAEKNGKLIHTYVQLPDFSACGAQPTDTEDVINMTLQVAGTEVAVIAVEQAGGAVKFSFRSRPAANGGQLDCRLLAEQFGGGGHKAAAGATLREPLMAARSKVLEAVRAAMG
ncbi:MAG: DHH family phosphoesterase [Planctomycetes bacterium]|nr:DHH family phosphoesterase [Planctomycetota bacterium]